MRRLAQPPLAPSRLALTLLVALAASACAGQDPTVAAGDGDAALDNRVDVVATTTQVQDFTRVVGGELVDVTGVLPPGVEAHDYAPSPADLLAVGQADVLVVNGLGLEEWLDATIDSAGFEGLLVDTSADVPVRTDDSGVTDPHIWHSPRNAMLMVEEIADGLAEADPPNADAYRANAEAYLAELEALDGEVAATMAALPSKRLVTNHDAFRYFTDAYDLEVVGAIIPSFDSSAELSGAEVADLVEQIRRTGTKAVFSESSLPARAAETVAREAGVRVVAGEDSLYGDSLGGPGSGAETYLDMVRHNADVIAGALGG